MRVHRLGDIALDGGLVSEVLDCPICSGTGDGEPVRSYRCLETGWEDAGPPPCRYCGGCGEVLARVEAERAACLAAAPWAVAS